MDKTRVFHHIRDVADYIKLPDEALAEVEAVINKIAADWDFEKKMKNIEAMLFATRTDDVRMIHSVADEKGVDRDLLTLAACLLFSIPMKQRYIDRGWSLDIYYDSLIDITIWAKVCYGITGKWGLKEYGWISAALFGQVVRIGRMQFEKIRIDFEDKVVNMDGITLKGNILAINVHIPEGDSLTEEKRLAAYRGAYNFFGQTGYAVYHCHSWLLYEKHRDFLPSGSNIISFMDDFHILPWATDDGNGDLWRVFGPVWSKAKDGNWDILPESSSLQRIYKERLKSGKSSGSSAGLFVFDGNSIVKGDFSVNE